MVAATLVMIEVEAAAWQQHHADHGTVMVAWYSTAL
jgi:hypothetical protein